MRHVDLMTVFYVFQNGEPFGKNRYVSSLDKQRSAHKYVNLAFLHSPVHCISPPVCKLHNRSQGGCGGKKVKEFDLELIILTRIHLLHITY